MTRSVRFARYLHPRFHVRVIVTESVHVMLTDEEIRYLEEPYKPRVIIGHV